MIRVGVIGIGFGQQVHVPAFRTDGRCEVAVVAASSQDRAQAVATRLGIPKAANCWQDVVEDPEINAISIAVPPMLQPQIAVAALRNGKPVFCEKPMAGAATPAREMAEAARRAGLANMIDYEFPEVDQWQRAKALLAQGTIGGLRHIVISWHVEIYANRMNLDSWKTRAEDGGGILNSFASHIFFYLEWLAGPICRLWAGLSRAPGDTRSGHTLATMSMELASGAMASVCVSTSAFLGSGHRLEFYGDEGTMRLENTTQDYINGFRLLLGTRSAGQFEPVDMRVEAAAADGRIVSVGRLVERFVDWIDHSTPAHPDFQDGCRVQALLEAARRSHESGCWVVV